MSVDYFFNSSLVIRQPDKGYRAGIVPLLLAAALDPSPGDRVLDAGTGVGVSAGALALRKPQVHIDGLEIQEELVELARKNIQTNHLETQIKIIQGDLLDPRHAIQPHTYEHVMTNPPFYDCSASRPSPNKNKQISHQLGEGGLQTWIETCLKALKPKGTMTVIHLASHMVHLLTLFEGKLGHIKIFPLWPHKREPAKLIILQGIKGSGGGSQFLPGLVLHRDDGEYTPEIKSILYEGQPLSL